MYSTNFQKIAINLLIIIDFEIANILLQLLKMNNQINSDQNKKLSWEDQNKNINSFNKTQNFKINLKVLGLNMLASQQQLNSEYKELYLKEIQKNQILESKIKQLELTLSKYQAYVPQQARQNLQNGFEDKQLKTQFLNKNKYSLLGQIKSFKSFLPNSMRLIDYNSEKNYIQKTDSETIISHKYVIISNTQQQVQLIDCFAIYQLKQSILSSDLDQSQASSQNIQTGQLVYCSKQKSDQIINQSSKLVFPQSYFPTFLDSQNAINKASYIVNFNLQYTKSFMLMFQPENITFQTQKQSNSQILSSSSQYSYEYQGEQSLLNLINQQQRLYAICICLEDFQSLQFKSQIVKKILNPDFDNSLDQDLFERHMNNQQNQNQLQNFEEQLMNINKTKVKTTKVAFTIFTKFPFLRQFQDTIKGILKVVFQKRSIICQKDKNKLSDYDCKLVFQQFKKQLQYILPQYQQKTLQLNKSFNLNINKEMNVNFTMKRESCENYFIQQWAYPLFSLFTLDTFIDVLTLMLLEEKIIFVCQNKHVVTYMIFLFVKILCRPFKYPYPVVSMIPNQFQYLNAPFPIVYGCVKQRKVIQKQKIMQKYKNIYVFINSQGASIATQIKVSTLLMKKSLKLRDKLMPQFIAMKKNYPKQKTSFGFDLTSFFGFKNTQHRSKQKKYNFQQNNKLISMSIVKIVKEFLTDIKNLFSNQKQIDLIKSKQIVCDRSIQAKENDKNSDCDLKKEIFRQLKQSAKKQTNDLFILSFLETQIVGVNISV